MRMFASRNNTHFPKAHSNKPCLSGMESYRGAADTQANKTHAPFVRNSFAKKLFITCRRSPGVHRFQKVAMEPRRIKESETEDTPCKPPQHECSPRTSCGKRQGSCCGCLRTTPQQRLSARRRCSDCNHKGGRVCRVSPAYLRSAQRSRSTGPPTRASWHGHSPVAWLQCPSPATESVVQEHANANPKDSSDRSS
jgi:hypothetical protein